MPKISQSWGKSGRFAENLTIFLTENAENLKILGKNGCFAEILKNMVLSANIFLAQFLECDKGKNDKNYVKKHNFIA